jgi:hypothetical protein
MTPTERAAEGPSVAEWMIEHGYATGHGDTVAQMLDELEASARASIMTHAIDPAIIERAAGAIYKLRVKECMYACLSWEDCDKHAKERARDLARAALASAIPEAVEQERARCVAEIMRMHRYVSAPSPFNSDILAIESKREAYELAAEMVAVLAFPWETERDQITRAAQIRARSAEQKGDMP